MADLSQLALLKRSIEQWNTWRKLDPDVRVNLYRADLSGANLSKANLSGTGLGGVYFGGVYFRDADLTYADLRGADLSFANLSRAYLRDADLSGANLLYADLTGANLSVTHLDGADLSHATLNHATLNGATLNGADLSYASLYNASLRRATLSGANFLRATLREANLSGTGLGGVYFRDADLSGADLTNTILTSADLTGADLTGAIRDAPPPKSSSPGSTSPSLGEKIITTLTSREATAIATFITIATGLTAFIGVFRHVAKQWSKKQSTDSASLQQHIAQPSETDIVAIRLRMTHGPDHEFEEWLTEPGRLKHYIDVFNEPSSSIQPLYAIFMQRNGKAIKVDVSKGTQNNLQLSELLSYLDIDSEEK